MRNLYKSFLWDTPCDTGRSGSVRNKTVGLGLVLNAFAFDYQSI